MLNSVFTHRLYIFNISFEPIDASTQAEVTEWLEPITETFTENVGRTHVFLDGSRTSCRLKECNLGRYRQNT